MEDLKKAKEINQLKEELQSFSADAKQILGNYYQDLDTRLEDIKSACTTAGRAMELVGELPLPNNIINYASLGGICRPELETAAKRIKEAVNEWQRETEKYSSLLSFSRLPTTNMPAQEGSLSSFKKYIENLRDALSAFNRPLELILNTKLDRQISDCLELKNYFMQAKNIRKFENNIQADYQRLSHRYGEKFQGIKTDWQKIINDLEWTKEFVELTKYGILSDDFIIHIANGVKITEEEWEQLDQSYQELSILVKKLEEYFDNTANYFSSVHFVDLSLDQIKEKIDDLEQKIDHLHHWNSYGNIIMELKRIGVESFIQSIVSQVPPPDTLFDVFQGLPGLLYRKLVI